MILLALVVVVLLAPPAPESGRARPSTAGRCEYAPVRPTYLPWLPEGALTRYSLDESGGPGEPVGVTVEGMEGELYRGEGETYSISWDIDDRCNYIELILALPKADDRELHDELIRVARSLR